MDQITTYATLQSAVAGMLHRTGQSAFTANVPLFIQLTEADLYDRLVLKDMETEETLTLTQDQNYVALPDGYLSPIALWLVVDGVRVLLTFALPQELPYDTDSTQPAYWAIDGANIRFDCPASEAYSAPFRFLKKSALSDSNTTNYLLERRPDIYLYGALKVAALFAKNNDELSKFVPLYEEAVRGSKAAEARHRKVPLRTDIGVTSRANILRGD